MLHVKQSAWSGSQGLIWVWELSHNYKFFASKIPFFFHPFCPIFLSLVFFFEIYLISSYFFIFFWFFYRFPLLKLNSVLSVRYPETCLASVCNRYTTLTFFPHLTDFSRFFYFFLFLIVRLHPTCFSLSNFLYACKQYHVSFPMIYSKPTKSKKNKENKKIKKYDNKMVNICLTYSW